MTTITTEEASVTIQTLRVGERKFTSALYRQLDAAALMNPDTGALRGRPLWRVNLHDTRCTKRFGGRPHLHILWVTDAGELRRADGSCPSTADTTPEWAARIHENWAMLVALPLLVVGA
jgi:hypothetical protein